jgi:hypothetical protein
MIVKLWQELLNVTFEGSESKLSRFSVENFPPDTSQENYPSKQLMKILPVPERCAVPDMFDWKMCEASPL